MNYEKIVLDNGLRIITVLREGTQAVTVLVLIKAGSEYESREINGISHFFEHMVFKGTGKRPKPCDISRPIESVGGILNAFTSEELTGYLVTVSNQRLSLALDLLSDMLLNSSFRLADIEAEKGPVIEEINMHNEVPQSRLEELWKELLYTEQPAGRPVLGIKETVQNLTGAKLRRFLRKHYVTNSTVVSIAGGLNPKEAQEKVKSYFAKLRTGPSLEKPVTLEDQSRPAGLFYEKKTEQTHLKLGVRTFGSFNPQSYALELLGVILGGNMSSRLFTSIREEKGLAYAISTATHFYSDKGYLVTSAGVNNEKVEEAIRAILEEYRKVNRENVTAEELRRAKGFIRGRMALHLESSFHLASFVGTQELLRGKILTPEEELEEMEKVTLEDIHRVAKEIFESKNLNLALIGPYGEENRERLHQLLTLG